MLLKKPFNVSIISMFDNFITTVLPQHTHTHTAALLTLLGWKKKKLSPSSLSDGRLAP